MPDFALPGRCRRALRLAIGLGTALFLSTAAVHSVTAAEPAFLAAVEDVPLMPGLHEVPDAATVFDAPQGRLVESFAAGNVAAPDIVAFYGQTLPQLGWTALDTGADTAAFGREGERLVLEITPGASSTTVRFTLSPQ